VRVPLTQEAWRDWLKIPVVSEGVLGGIDPLERARRIDEAYASCDAASWRFESWALWTATARA
jgi:hypothetical protein